MIETQEIIEAVADQAHWDPVLLKAQIQVESGGNTYAWNPEPRYAWMWNVFGNQPFRPLTSMEVMSEGPPTDFRSLAGDPDQEWWGQKASWGLLQIMGAVAREVGFRGPYLPQLTDPLTNLRMGMTKIISLNHWAQGDLARTLAAYNGGKAGNEVPPFRNQVYADKVLSAWNTLKGVA